MRRLTAGFTAIELLLVVVIGGIMMSVAIPYLRSSSQRTSVHGAADEISRLYATARAASIQRGKTAWLVMQSSTSTVLVIAKKANATGIDTVAQPDKLSTRYGVTFTTTTDSLVFTPRGVGANLSATTVVLTSITGVAVDTVTIYPTGTIQR